MKTDILGVPVDSITKIEALKQILEYLNSDTGNHIIITPNPEMIIEAEKDKEFMNIMKLADMVVPDGIGVVLASKLNKVKIKERVPGCDLTEAVMKNIADTKKTIYLFGGKPGVCEKAKLNLENKYKNLKIVGIHDGYFDSEEEAKIKEEIKLLKPDLLLVGLGVPKQEKWIFENKNILPVKVSVGVGGSLDVYAGTVKRAPLFFQKFALEWFYRLIKQPSRFIRMLRLPIFVFKVMLYKLRR